MITTHVLDIAKGRPAAGIPVTLEMRSGEWLVVGEGTTDPDGRVRTLWPHDRRHEAGAFRLTFQTADYLGRGCFYSEIQIMFEIQDASQHYHVPLLLSPYGYSTYRGS